MKITIYQSKKGDERFLQKIEPETPAVLEKEINSIIVNPKDEKQEWLGFGGAFTEASTFTFSLLSQEQKQEFIDEYFSENGSNYTYARIPLASSDFGLGTYDYLSREGDISSFSLDHENLYLFPFLDELRKRIAKPLHYLASPWSPPSYMKSNHCRQHGGYLLPKYYEEYAIYEAKYLKEMAKRGINFDFLTIQNEVEAKQTWDSCLFSSDQEAAYIPYLRSRLDKDGFSKVGLYIIDHNKDIIVERSKKTLSSPKIREEVEGIAFHYYVSKEYENLTKVHQLFPEKTLFYTEGCKEMAQKDPSKRDFGSFENAESYADDIINNLNNYTKGYCDWNILLNEEGGPNYVGNFCDAPVIYNRITKQLFYTPTFYFIRHFSHFMSSGDIIVSSRNDFEKGINSLAIKKKDGSLIVIIQNETDEEKNCLLEIKNGGQHFLKLASHSLLTILINQ